MVLLHTTIGQQLRAHKQTRKRNCLKIFVLEHNVVGDPILIYTLWLKKARMLDATFVVQFPLRGLTVRIYYKKEGIYTQNIQCSSYTKMDCTPWLDSRLKVNMDGSLVKIEKHCMGYERKNYIHPKKVGKLFNVELFREQKTPINE